MPTSLTTFYRNLKISIKNCYLFNSKQTNSNDVPSPFFLSRASALPHRNRKSSGDLFLFSSDIG